MIRLSDEVLSWLDAHRGGEPRVVLIRAILREHIRRQGRQPRRGARQIQRPWLLPAGADRRSTAAALGPRCAQP